MSYKSNIYKMYTLEFLIHFLFFSAVLVPFFISWGKISFTEIMFLQAWFSFCVFLLETPTGAVADKFGRKISVALGALFFMIGVLVYGSYPNIYIFILGEFLMAISVTLLSGADEAIIYDSLKKIKEEKTSKKIFARFDTSHLLGIMGGSLIGSLIAASYGTRSTMLLSAIPCFLAFLIALTLEEPKTRQKRKNYFKIWIDGLKYFKSHGALKILTFDLISVGILGYILIWAYQPLLSRAGISIAYFGLVHALMVVGEITFMNAAPKIESFISKKMCYFIVQSLQQYHFFSLHSSAHGS